MKILAVDTALGACSVAVTDGAQTLAHCWEAMPRGHAEALAPMVERTMHEARLEFGGIERLAVTTGPGTFTGQRVGMAFMRGLRLALSAPLVGINTLEAMGAAASSGNIAVAVLHEAKRGEVYGAVYRGGIAVVPVQVAEFDTMLRRVGEAARTGSEIVFAGTAAEAAIAAWRDRGPPALLSAVRQPDALWVARIARGLPEPLETPRPLYLRAPDAKLPTPPNVRFRAAGKPDCATLAALQAETFPPAWDAQFFEGIIDTPGGFALMAEAAGRTVGFALARAVAGEAELLAIGIDASHRRRGVGRLILQKTADKAAFWGADALFLEVAADNLAARNLYESQGFQCVGRREKYYRGGIDALVLRVPLPFRKA